MQRRTAQRTPVPGAKNQGQNSASTLQTMVAELKLPLRSEEGKGSLRRVVLNLGQIHASRFGLSPHIAWQTKRATAWLRIGLLLKSKWSGLSADIASSRLEHERIFAREISRVLLHIKTKNHFVTKTGNTLGKSARREEKE
jgi:hypothetical protein